MWNYPTEKQLAKVPKFYSTEETKAEDKIIHMHFFLGGCDWYVAEYDKESNTFFAFCILNSDFQNAEWGYVSLDELKGVRSSFVEVDREIHWRKTRAGDIDNIQKAS